MNTELLAKIEALAGDQRRGSFRLAGDMILERGWKSLVETGCYRGIEADGMSTMILAFLADECDGRLLSCELNPEHIQRAKTLLSVATLPPGLLPHVRFAPGDSVATLSLLSDKVNFAYLDSYDHDANNPGPCQRHQLAEVGAILGKMTQPGAILLDDCDFTSGGKCLLSDAFLVERGWNRLYAGYQRLYVNFQPAKT